MKNLLFATAFAVAAFSAVPALAQVTGHVGAAVSHTEIETPLGDADGQTFSASASAYSPLEAGAGLQVDVFGSDADDVEGTIGGAAHVVAELSKGRLAGFVSVSTTDGEALWGTGVEGQTYLGEKITLGGTLAYAKDEASDVEMVGLNGQGRFFANDNLRIDANVGYVDIQDADVSAWVAGIGGEHQFAGKPISVFGGYTRVEIEDIDVSADILSLGVRYNFGGQSLKQRDRNGAAMEGFGALTAGLLF